MMRIKPLLQPQQLRSALAPFACQAATTTTTITAFQPASISSTSIRASSSSSHKPAPTIPPPTPFVPDVGTFLKIIGRGLSQHASKFPTWESLFSLTSDQLRELGVEPPRTRRYLLQWRQRFLLKQYGIGGEAQHVQDGKADLRILNVGDVVPRKYVVNVPPGQSVSSCKPEELSRVSGYKVQGANTIAGPYAVQLKKAEGAQITITEGMWEDRRGHKIDGGERRRTEVRYKKRIAERREMRERGEL
ncbi:telomere length regulation protein [Parahypoxylon ruwenzoriense]